MKYMVSDITALSSRGQIVLPKAIRDALGIDIGTKFVVFSDGDNVLLKPLKEPDLKEFNKLMDKAQKWAASVGMTEEDIDDAVKTVRRKKRNSV